MHLPAGGQGTGLADTRARGPQSGAQSSPTLPRLRPLPCRQIRHPAGLRLVQLGLLLPLLPCPLRLVPLRPREPHGCPLAVAFGVRSSFPQLSPFYMSLLLFPSPAPAPVVRRRRRRVQFLSCPLFFAPVPAGLRFRFSVALRRGRLASGRFAVCGCCGVVGRLRPHGALGFCRSCGAL